MSDNVAKGRWTQSLRAYFLGGGDYATEGLPTDLEDLGLWETGQELVDRVVEAIRTRRSVLLTGPRGSGKSYCAKKGIVVAWQREQLLGGYKFLQGNREIPRDLLSEDMLVLDDQGNPFPLEALAIRPLKEKDQRVEDLRKTHPKWPAIRARDVGMDYFEARKAWSNEDWTALYLDEITRFADGFLDSLLSLTEERVIVRRGEDYFVPLVVVATANPPGYDATAKKLSPPLQARISRSYRVSQPSLHVLAGTIVREQLPEINRGYPPTEHYPPDGHLIWLAAGATLCLWGDPDTKANRGTAYLTRPTKQLLRDLMARDPDLATAMRQLSSLIIFGPDSRAVLDWLACAIGRAHTAGRMLSAQDLTYTAVEVLGHKVRESFNEGAEPDRLLQRDYCIRKIVERVLTNGRLRDLLVNDLRAAAAVFRSDTGSVSGVEQDLRELLAPLPPERRAVWLQALVAVDGLAYLSAEALRNRWEPAARQFGALAGEEEFYNEQERRAVSELFSRLHAERDYGRSMMQWAVSRHGQFETLLPRRAEVVRQFESDLQPFLERYPVLLATEAGQQAWLEMLEGLLAPEDLTPSALRRLGWGLLAAYFTPETGNLPYPNTVLRLAYDSVQAVGAVANRVGRARVRQAVQCLEHLQDVPFDAAAEEVAVTLKRVEEPLRAGLIRHSFSLNNELERRGEDGTGRVKIWLEYLRRVARGEPAELTSAEACLEAPGRFRDGFERDWVLQLLDQLRPERESHLGTARALLSRTPVSPAPMLPGRDAAPATVRDAFLDVLRPRPETADARERSIAEVEKPLFDDYGKPRREAAQELRRLFMVLARSARNDSSELLAEGLRSVASFSVGDEFLTRLSFATAFVCQLLHRWAMVNPGATELVERATTELGRFNQELVSSAATYLTGRDGNVAMVSHNGNRLLHHFANLAQRMVAARADDLLRVSGWLNALASPEVAASADELHLQKVLQDKRVVSVNGFILLEERAWLRDLATDMQHRLLHDVAERMPLDREGLIDRLASKSDHPGVRTFLLQTITMLDSHLRGGDTRLLAGLLTFYRDYWVTPEAERTATIQREAQRLNRGAEVDISTAATVLQSVLTQVGPPGGTGGPTL